MNMETMLLVPYIKQDSGLDWDSIRPDVRQETKGSPEGYSL